MRRATIKRAGADAIQIKGQQRDDKGGNTESGCRGYTVQRGRRRRERVTIQKTGAAVLPINWPQRDEKSVN